MALIYKPNEKHKRGASGEGPPRFFPSNASECPDDFSVEVAQELLVASASGASPAHPDSRARYAYFEGTFYKGYPEGLEGENELWHGYPVHPDLVGSEVPARVLREFRDQGLISRAQVQEAPGARTMNQFGRRSAFAIQILPLGTGPGDGDRSAELTWSGWAIWVDGRNITTHSDVQDDRVCPTVNWPAIYLARWLVRAWPMLFESARWPLPTRARNARLALRELDRALVRALDTDEEDRLIELRDAFACSHDLRSGAAGGICPGVFFSRDGDLVTVNWFSPPDDRVVFHSQEGEADIPSSDFIGAVEGFIGWILDQLGEDELEPVASDRALLSQWLASLDGEPAARAVIQGHSGLDDTVLASLQNKVGVTDFAGFYDLPAGWDQNGGRISPMVSPVAMAYRSTAPDMPENDLLQIRELVLSSDDNPDGRAKLERLRRSLPGPYRGSRDYEQGYSMAETLRQLLGQIDNRLDIDHLMSNELRIQIHDVELHSPDIEGGCLYDDAHGPVIFVNPGGRMSQSRWGRRMTLAHELCRLLFDRPPALPLAHLSGLWSIPRFERRANAFAAELLLPRAGIIATLGSEPTAPTDGDLQTLMDTFEVGQTTASWHVTNRFDLI